MCGPPPWRWRRVNPRRCSPDVSRWRILRANQKHPCTPPTAPARRRSGGRWLRSLPPHAPLSHEDLFPNGLCCGPGGAQGRSEYHPVKSPGVQRRRGRRPRGWSPIPCVLAATSSSPRTSSTYPCAEHAALECRTTCPSAPYNRGRRPFSRLQPDAVPFVRLHRMAPPPFFSSPAAVSMLGLRGVSRCPSCWPPGRCAIPQPEERPAICGGVRYLMQVWTCPFSNARIIFISNDFSCNGRKRA